MAPILAARRAELSLVGATQPRRLSPESAPIGVVIADAQALVRAGFRALLEAQADVAVLGEAEDFDEAIETARRLSPAVLLIDSALDGAGVARRVATDPELAGVQVVMLSRHASDGSMLDALRSGVSGFLLKDTRPGQLLDAVRAAAAGESFLSPKVARRLIDELAALPETTRPSPQLLDELTPRELEVVALVAGGMSNREIAEHLVLSPATAKTHVSRALRKLDARDRAQLVTLAYESGLVAPRPVG
jgi:DNA-binding NarL/FixJ family response regulator